MSISNQKKFEYLKRLINTNKLPHALLVSGVSAKDFTFQIFGEDITKKVHPDFIFIEPIDRKIHIEQIRDCIWRMSLTPFNNPLKVAVIDQAHLLNQDSQSALLKTLEEPKGKTLLILVTDYPKTLFSTVLSRVQRIKFLKTDQKPQEKIIKEIAKIAQLDLANKFKYVEKVAKDEALKEILIAWMYYLREDLVKNRVILQKFLDTYYLISRTNLNTRLALENLMLNL
jgi:DNA polymerase III delta prime subunit